MEEGQIALAVNKFYIPHNTAAHSEDVSERMRKEVGAEFVADIRAEDNSVPDDGAAGHYWLAAQVSEKICDMYAAGLITNNDMFIFTWPKDPNIQLVRELNEAYDVSAKIHHIYRPTEVNEE